MRAYIEGGNAFRRLDSQEDMSYIEIVDSSKNYGTLMPCRPLPWRMEYDDEELGLIDLVPYDSEEITLYEV